MIVLGGLIGLAFIIFCVAMVLSRSNGAYGYSVYAQCRKDVLEWRLFHDLLKERLIKDAQERLTPQQFYSFDREFYVQLGKPYNDTSDGIVDAYAAAMKYAKND